MDQLSQIHVSRKYIKFHRSLYRVFIDNHSHLPSFRHCVWSSVHWIEAKCKIEEPQPQHLNLPIASSKFISHVPLTPITNPIPIPSQPLLHTTYAIGSSAFFALSSFILFPWSTNFVNSSLVKPALSFA